jgi:hypothetical protein
MGRLRVATTTEFGPYVAFGEGVRAYDEIRAEATGGPLPAKLEFTLKLERDRYVVKSLQLSEPGIGLTGELLRRIPLATLVRMAVEDGTVEMLRMRRPKLPVGREGPSDDVLRFVARNYRYAVLMGEPQIEFVREKLNGPSRATTARWINLARERGFWQPYEEG